VLFPGTGEERTALAVCRCAAGAVVSICGSAEHPAAERGRGSIDLTGLLLAEIEPHGTRPLHRLAGSAPGLALVEPVPSCVLSMPAYCPVLWRPLTHTAVFQAAITGNADPRMLIA
jgi:hypothetical protein